MAKPLIVKELKKMAANIVDEATSQFIDYMDGMPGEQPSTDEKWDFMDLFWDTIIKEIKKKRG